MKKFCIFVFNANANVSVQSVLFMVNYFLNLGKHKGHDVKTIRKSMPLIKIEMDKFQ